MVKHQLVSVQKTKIVLVTLSVLYHTLYIPSNICTTEECFNVYVDVANIRGGLLFKVWLLIRQMEKV